jgi:hypothetical protein
MEALREGGQSPSYQIFKPSDDVSVKVKTYSFSSIASGL